MTYYGLKGATVMQNYTTRSFITSTCDILTWVGRMGVTSTYSRGGRESNLGPQSASFNINYVINHNT